MPTKMDMQLELNDLTLLDKLCAGKILEVLKTQKIITDTNIVRNELKAARIIVLISELELSAAMIGIEPNYENFDIQWINENPYVNLETFSVNNNNGTTSTHMSLIMASFFLNNIDLMFKKNQTTYMSLNFIRIIPSIVENLESKVNIKDIHTEVSKFKTYLMIDENTGFHKIGKAISPEYRERTLQSEKPTIKLLSVTNRDIESLLHKKYEIKRVRGEWFNLNKNDVDDILSIFIIQN